MTRTPTNSVTAIAIAARALTWDDSGSAHFPDLPSGTSPLLR
jgi:hypothetical protein